MMNHLTVESTKPVCRFRNGRAGTAAFTLVETIVAMAIFAVGSGILYQSFIANVVLASKNAALNTGNAGMQKSYAHLLKRLEASPAFVDCANYSPSTTILTGVPKGTWGNAVRFMQIISPALYIEPVDGSGYSVTNPPPPTRQVYIPSYQYVVSLTADPAVGISSINGWNWTNGRLWTSYPRNSGPGQSTYSPGTKPGLAFNGGWTQNGNQICMMFNSGPGANTLLDCNKAFIVVESAFVVITNQDGSKTLNYVADPQERGWGGPIRLVPLCNFLDGGNQTQIGDSTIPAGGTAGTFCMNSAGDTVSVLLPIRSPRSLNVMSRRGGAAARNNTWVNVNVKFRQRQDL